MARLEVFQFPTRSDNYGVLIHDPATEATASIDAPDAEQVLAALHQMGWTLTHILVTHHHHDHTAGNEVLRRMTGCTIIGPEAEARSIPGIDVQVKEGDIVEIGESRAPRADDRMADEATAVAKTFEPGAVRVVLDAAGKPLSSEELAARLGRWRETQRFG